MFSEITTALTGPTPTSSSSYEPPLTHPLYLLPSLRLPFRRRRPSLTKQPAPSSSSQQRTSQPPTLRCQSCATDLAHHAQIISKGFTGQYGRAYLVAPPSPLTTPSCPSSPVDPDHPANLINIRVGPAATRELVTGTHVVADIHCATCDAKVGWKYLDARQPSQRYKIGKFILETKRVVVFTHWEESPSTEDGYQGDVSGGVWTREKGAKGSSSSSKKSSKRSSRPSSSAATASRASSRSGLDGGGWEEERTPAVEFDSSDEEECEELFSGAWDADVVARRRSGRMGRV